MNARRLTHLLEALCLSTILGLAGNAGAVPIWTTQGDGTGLGTIDSATGAGTAVGPFGVSQAWAAAFDLDGTLFTTYNGFSGNAQLATVDMATGNIATTIGGLGVSGISLEVDSTGQLWGVGYTDGVLYKIDKTTGATTAVGSTGVSATMDLAFDSAGNLYSTVANRLYQLDLSTGGSTLVATITGIAAGSVMGIMFDASDNLFATNYAPDSWLYSVAPPPGAATGIGSTGFRFAHGGDIFIARVPEPASLSLLVAGLLGLGLARRRRKTPLSSD